MPSLAEVSRGIYGAWRLARLDRAAIGLFDCTIHGVIRSFWAAAICYPAVLLMLVTRPDAADLDGGGLFRLVLVQSIGYVIQWAAYPLIALRISRWLAPEERALGFIIAFNWSQVIQMAVVLVVALVTRIGIITADVAPVADLVVYVLCLVYEWFIARLVLEAGRLPATVLVLLDVVIFAIVSQVTISLAMTGQPPG
jgi:hypothetical protein